MKLAVPSPAYRLGQIFKRYGVRLFLVGGYVRNSLLHLPGSDLDVCSAATPELIDEICKREKLHHFKKGKFGTIEIRLRNGRNVDSFEHTTYRSDVYKEGGHHRPVAVKFTDDIARDALRRDFTANALYMDVQTGEIIDPTGRGVSDIKAGVLRACMKDPWDTMNDDAHRILRMVRIACETGFSIEDVTFRAARYNSRYLINIAFERVREEFIKTITSDAKYGRADGPARGIKLLDSLSALEYILPSLSQTKGVALPACRYSGDLFSHLTDTMLYCPPLPELRLAALYHDIARGVCSVTDPAARGHEKLAVQDARVELARLRFSGAQINAVCTLIEQHMFDHDNSRTPAQIRKKLFELGPETFSSLAALRAADERASKRGSAASAALERELAAAKAGGVPLTVADLKIDGEDIKAALSLTSGKRVGEVLKGVLSACVADPSLDTKEKQLAAAKGALARPPRRRRRRKRQVQHLVDNP